MKDHLIAERYAKALAACIEDDGQLDARLATLQDIAEVYHDHPNLSVVLANPAIRRETREKILDEVLALAGTADVVADFVRTLYRRGRIETLPNVATLFGDMVDERMNRISAHVTTAAPLTPEHEQQIQKGLEAYSGKSVYVTTTVDPGIIGGVVVRLDGAIIDGSLRARFERVKQTLLAEET